MSLPGWTGEDGCSYLAISGRRSTGSWRKLAPGEDMVDEVIARTATRCEQRPAGHPAGGFEPAGGELAQVGPLVVLAQGAQVSNAWRPEAAREMPCWMVVIPAVDRVGIPLGVAGGVWAAFQ